jgi:Fungal chitosanase of glycosyl hydrolase group 75
MAKRILKIGTVVSAVCVANVVLAADFTSWQSFKGVSLLRDAASKAYCYKTTHAAIDADGAPNAYHPGDVGKNCTKDTHLGLDCPANAGFPNSTWWDSVLVPDPADASKPFVQKSGPYKGYFVAMTWLQNPDSAIKMTDPAKYVDSNTVPYIVFPGSKFGAMSGTGYAGDIGMAYNLETGKSTGFVVADQGGGNDATLGEGSIALFKALGGSNLNPRTGAGVAEGAMVYVVFPGSRKNFSWPSTPDKITEAAKARILALGGEAALAPCRD